ncbi:biotin transporter BioY [Weissella ceti]|uniref:Biotin transporter n=1 Tax=Weissella ceti TaxID=759620 RepID=A0ABT3E3Y7_9LACO|nr:biotin transporter BioY [Weissella ceti]MCW0953129.1 biotin transporter BioY [Weissella ceti]QVK12648.1 biotin transporter BioY [Weissella ceti]
MNVKELSLTGILLSMVLVLAPMTVPLGIVPFSMQTFIIPMAVCLLSRRNGLLLVAAYLLLGGFGLPVFANWHGGWAVFAGPTGGYLIGLLAFPLIVGRLGQAKNEWLTVTVSLLLAGTLQLFIGGIWLANIMHTSLIAGLQMGVFPFVLMMFVKTAAVMSVLKIIAQRKILTNIVKDVI